MSKPLPTPHPEAIHHSQACFEAIKTKYAPATQIPFEAWMDTALYLPYWGYYTGGLPKLSGENTAQSALQGDFTTAPELSPWYGRALAIQVQQVLDASQSHTILEFGAGSGKLALSILEQLNNPSIHYFILELSADLRERQKATLHHYTHQITWLDQLPSSFEGCIIANEVLDAMPVKLVQWNQHHQLEEVYVSWENGLPSYKNLPASTELSQIMSARMPALPHYQTEINLRGEAWVKAMGSYLKKGGALLIDYGFPRHEYYHPQRHQGTLMCHFQHHAHDNPLIYVGLQDITAHVDFTAIADAALEGGLEVLGYTSQARFLMNCGLLNLLSQLDPQNVQHYAQQIGPVQKLLSEAEMGELFKVMLLGKELDIDPIGFMNGDRRYML
ncbi:class I SAM-dependent methyltransferase [Pelistega ratti]|uniref:class I SAM-dependent methyltransferase n=1 Tax=Pelistega ratti TaxID=2652177 RepID=UPI001356BBC9|nr:SAM-dependent methyltransferase [Pelistega ratti]